MHSSISSEVKIVQGIVRGAEEDGVCRFLGIPYAKPPVGELRWQAPQPPEPWPGVRDAFEFGPAAVQTVGAGFNIRASSMSEDCLTLNVWTANLTPDARQPVMLWIHGGGNLGGSRSEDAFDGANLARQGITAVTFNYRLGAFGFLAHPDVGANFGVLDYVAVLEWVRDNISQFGGDPGNVTIFGESAGAVAVRTLLSTPKARGLFHRGIIQSAGFEQYSFAPGWSYDRAEAAAERLFERLGSRDLDVLRQIPTEELRIASHENCGIFPPPGQVHTPANLVWMPVPDNEILMAGSFPGWPEDVPVMFGCLENEARYFIKPQGSYDWNVVRHMATALAGPKADDVMAVLKGANLSPYEALDKLFSTVIWFEPALATIKRFGALGRRFYYYHFARVSPGARKSQDLVKHSAEIRYVFGNLTDDQAYDETDRVISAGLQNAWIEFARTGVPRSPDGSAWPAYNDQRSQISWIEDDFQARDLDVSELTSIIHSLRT
ncbi:carboxylesterase/lipase family protein [Govanella unica]|uniref:Carboxylic ester hydrolase n=1 Tax=Govanella unica TaxID=2975056 RepID=A0A9X3Z7R9_9PROT|nr:carboxylesterase family protein [Govania unica]MDA5194446.1 carboxylesterase family protein [Govania unica]